MPHLDPLSLAVGFLLFVAVRITLPWVAARYDGWRKWYRGLSIFYYLGMTLMLVGAKFLKTGKGGLFMQKFNGRLWISPDVAMFRDEKTS